MVLNDFLRGKIPWFTAPPFTEGEDEKTTGVEGREGRLGEMRKRKRDDDTTTIADSTADASGLGDEDDDNFEGFNSEDGGAEIDDDDISIDSDDGMPDSDSEVEDEGPNSDEAAENQLKAELKDEVAVAEPSSKPQPKKRRKKST